MDKKSLLNVAILLLAVSFSFCNDNSVGPGNINSDNFRWWYKNLKYYRRFNCNNIRRRHYIFCK